MDTDEVSRSSLKLSTCIIFDSLHLHGGIAGVCGCAEVRAHLRYLGLEQIAEIPEPAFHE
jgi:hypothetical protein